MENKLNKWNLFLLERLLITKIVYQILRLQHSLFQFEYFNQNTKSLLSSLYATYSMLQRKYQGKLPSLSLLFLGIWWASAYIVICMHTKCPRQRLDQIHFSCSMFFLDIAYRIWMHLDCVLLWILKWKIGHTLEISIDKISL